MPTDPPETIAARYLSGELPLDEAAEQLFAAGGSGVGLDASLVDPALRAKWDALMGRLLWLRLRQAAPDAMPETPFGAAEFHAMQAEVHAELHQGDSSHLDRVYRATRFRPSVPIQYWPAAFVIISAYATSGEQWTEEENRAADRKLSAELTALNVWCVQITGYSPETGHAEPSWAVELPVETGREIGRRYRQDAIFVVQDGELGYVRGAGDDAVVWIGRFEVRVDATGAST